MADDKARARMRKYQARLQLRSKLFRRVYAIFERHATTIAAVLDDDERRVLGDAHEEMHRYDPID
jgi:hypothetical protein